MNPPPHPVLLHTFMYKEHIYNGTKLNGTHSSNGTHSRVRVLNGEVEWGDRLPQSVQLYVLEGVGHPTYNLP